MSAARDQPVASEYGSVVRPRLVDDWLIRTNQSESRRETAARRGFRPFRSWSGLTSDWLIAYRVWGINQSSQNVCAGPAGTVFDVERPHG